MTDCDDHGWWNSLHHSLRWSTMRTLVLHRADTDFIGMEETTIWTLDDLKDSQLCKFLWTHHSDILIPTQRKLRCVGTWSHGAYEMCGLGKPATVRPEELAGMWDEDERFAGTCAKDFCRSMLSISHQKLCQNSKPRVLQRNKATPILHISAWKTRYEVLMLSPFVEAAYELWMPNSSLLQQQFQISEAVDASSSQDHRFNGLAFANEMEWIPEKVMSWSSVL